VPQVLTCPATTGTPRRENAKVSSTLMPEAHGELSCFETALLLNHDTHSHGLLSADQRICRCIQHAHLPWDMTGSTTSLADHWLNLSLVFVHSSSNIMAVLISSGVS
jgi:hypothetical protein